MRGSRPDITPKCFHECFHVSSHRHEFRIVVWADDQWIFTIFLLQAREVTMAKRMLPLWSAQCCCTIMLCSYRTPLPAILREVQLLLWLASKCSRENNFLIQSPVELRSNGTHLEVGAMVSLNNRNHFESWEHLARVILPAGFGSG